MNYINNVNDIDKKDKKVWIALAPDYANVGDIAISIAQAKILEEAYPDRKIIEFPMISFFKYKNKIMSLMNDDDIITIIGGGNMGNIYIEGEERRRDIITSFPNNKIISFPQSIDFENTDIGLKELQTSADVYGNHKDLTIFSREERSHNIMKENFKNDVKLVPDTVMYLTGKVKNDKNIKREKAFLCFRNDKEKVTARSISCNFVDLLVFHDYKDIEISDTSLGNTHFKPEEKIELLDKTLDKFRSAKFVATDRLHGMIFALITKTPCIAFDNSNKKISSTYNTWLKDVPYIKLLNSFEELAILKHIKDFSKLSEKDFEIDFSSNFKTLFESLAENN